MIQNTVSRNLAAIAVGAALASPAMAADFGQKVEALAKARSVSLFGVKHPLGASSTLSVTAATANADPTALVTLADGLTAKVVSDAPGLGANVDMMALWPNDQNPTHLIVCNEQGTGNAGVQRVAIATGIVEDIISAGLQNCDPAHRTPWATVVVGEEAGAGGQLVEILDPLTTTGVTVDRVNGTSSDPAKVAFRRAPGRLSFEGLGIYPNGVLYYGDEKRPGSGSAGGSYFKFIPTNLWTGSSPIHDLDASPLVSGRVFGLRIGARNDNTDFGQGTPAGKGVWVEIPDANNVDLGAAAANLKLTGYYRPEDLAIDQKARAAGKVRFCGNNTGEDGQTLFYGETFCLTDGSLSQAADTGTLSTPEYQTLVVGFADFAMMDNIAYQPGRGNWLIQEDGEGPEFGRNNDIWSCRDDGADQNLLADACVKVVSLNDLTAESTGGVFDASGQRYFVSIQHNVTGHGVILEIDGWK